MVIGVLCRVIFHSCRLRVYVTEHESPVVSSASETTLPYTLRSSLERTTIIAMSDIAQHILSLLTLSVPGESAASPSQAPPSDDDSDPQVPASATDTFPSPSPSFNSYLGLARLRARASHLLTVFDDPRFAPLDVPDWARRCHARITVRGLVQAMCAAAQELGLADGERYVLDAVCACEPAAQEERGRTDHSRTHSATVTEGGAEAGGEADALARRLQHLASAWVAFLLWPCTSSSPSRAPLTHSHAPSLRADERPGELGSGLRLPMHGALARAEGDGVRRFRRRRVHPHIVVPATRPGAHVRVQRHLSCAYLWSWSWSWLGV